MMDGRKDGIANGMRAVDDPEGSDPTMLVAAGRLIASLDAMGSLASACTSDANALGMYGAAAELRDIVRRLKMLRVAADDAVMALAGALEDGGA